MDKPQKPVTLSPTKVDTFYNCQRLFYYTYLNPPFVVPQKKWFVIGNIAHKALENFHKRKDLDASLKKAMGESFKEAVMSHNGLGLVASGLLRKSDLFDVKNMLGDYLYHLKATKDQVNVVSLERLDKLVIDNVIVWLKADRIDQPETDCYRVIDYKTSNEPPSKKDQLASVQLQSYGLLIRQKFSKVGKIQGSYMYLRHLKSKKGISTLDISEEMMEQAKQKYVDVHSKIMNGCAYRPNYAYKYCRNCDYRLYCLQNKGLSLKEKP